MEKYCCRLNVKYAANGHMKDTTLYFHEKKWTWSTENQDRLCKIIEEIEKSEAIGEQTELGSVILVTVQEVQE